MENNETYGPQQEGVVPDMNTGAEPIETAEMTEQEKRALAKQQEKEEKKAKEFWNGMITRKEAYEMVQDTYAQMQQQLQLLMIQNRTLLEMFTKKGIATEQEINDHSKEVMESIFGPLDTSVDPTMSPVDPEAE